MLPLIQHILSISARRDRTEVNGALLDGLEELAVPHLRALRIHRVFTGRSRTTLFDCAGIGSQGRYLRNAYFPEVDHCFEVEQDPLLSLACERCGVVASRTEAGGERIVLPIAPGGLLLYLIDLHIDDSTPPERRTLLMALVEFCSNHIGLLDYGETDNLSGLPNRKTFDKHLFELMGLGSSDASTSRTLRERRLERADARHWLAVCDVDHFKRVNDNFGHLIGDEVLVMFARLMRESFRFQDQLFRFGGEEFVVVLQPTSDDAVPRVFERFRKAVASHRFSRVGHVTVSIGYSPLVPRDTPADVIDRADEALYWVKRNGRNATACYENLVDQGRLQRRAPRDGAVELF